MGQLRDQALEIFEFNLRAVPKIFRAVLDQHDPAKCKNQVQAEPGEEPCAHAGNMGG